MPVVTESDVMSALKQVYDPEIPVNIFDLGFSNLEFRFEVLRLNYARQVCSWDNLLALLCGHLLQDAASAGRDAQVLNLLLLEFQ